MVWLALPHELRRRDKPNHTPVGLAGRASTGLDEEIKTAAASEIR
jgi:hypothetical protein